MNNESVNFELQLVEAKNEIERLRQGLQEIADCVGSPDIDPSGEIEFGLHCGVEDRDIADRYNGANFGYAQGVERTLEWAANLAKYTLQEKVKS